MTRHPRTPPPPITPAPTAPRPPAPPHATPPPPPPPSCRPGNPRPPAAEVSAAEVHGPLRCSLEYPAVPEHPAAPGNPGDPDNPGNPRPPQLRPRPARQSHSAAPEGPTTRQSHPASPGGAYYKSVSIPGETSERNPPIRPILYHLVQFSGILDQKVWAEGIVFLLLPRFCMPGGMPSINQTNSL